MAQRKPEDKINIDQVLRLVHKLSAEERKQLLEQLTIEDLSHEIQQGIDAADRGELLPAEQVFAELKQRNTARLKDNT